jgi:hypothetical protein
VTTWARAASLWAAAGSALALGLAGCPTRPQPNEAAFDANTSPNATILPAPLAATTPPPLEPEPDAARGETRVGIPADSKGRLVVPDASMPPPVPVVPGHALPADALPGREVSGVSLVGEWLFSHVPSPPHAPEVAGAGIEAARKLLRKTWAIEIAEAGRMRTMIDSIAFALPRYAELRARYDRLGHVLVWPSGEQYRVLPPGTLRTLLDDRRVDATPLVQERSTSLPSAGVRFKFPTSRVRVETAHGKVVLDQAHVVSAGLGGPLLCRALLELVAVDPAAAPSCAPNLVPVRAEYTWPEGPTLVFEVTALAMRTDLLTGLLATPPAAAAFAPSGLPPNASGIFLTREQLAAFRSRPIEAARPRTDHESKGAPAEGFTAVNLSDALRFLLIDGVPVAWVPAHGEQYVIGTAPGRYVVQWRSFLGSFVGAAATVELPALLKFGEVADAAAGPAPKASAAGSR